MEFHFNVNEILPGRITIIESKDTNCTLTVYDLESIGNSNKELYNNWTCNLSANKIWNASVIKKQENLEYVIDQMGHASALAQDLRSTITTFRKLLNSIQQKLYIIRDAEIPHSVIGILKIGLKRLFICDELGAHHETDAICVLDFYVHESKQRSGYGHELFNTMLQVEKIEPSKLAIDRPSFKLLAFLNKHYGLKDPKAQANNFIVYAGFFDDRSEFQVSNSAQSTISKSLNNLEAAQISPRKDTKSKSYHATTENSGLDGYYKKKRIPSASQYHSPSMNFMGGNSWRVYDALHNFSSNDNNFEPSRKAHSSQCSLTPVDNDNTPSQKKWSQLQSSWNVLGVKPMDYSIIQKKS